MLPKALRLPSSRAKTGKRVKTPFLLAYLEPNGLNNNRFLFVVSKKTAKTAVLRHKIQRLLGEAARTLPPKGLDFTIIASPEAAGLNLKEAKEEFQKILK